MHYPSLDRVVLQKEQVTAEGGTSDFRTITMKQLKALHQPAEVPVISIPSFSEQPCECVLLVQVE
jgi:hypothetical protein